MTTRAKNLKLIKHLFDTVGYDEDQVKYLSNKGLRSPAALLQAYTEDHTMDYYLDETEFPGGDVSVLRKLAQYLQWTIETVGNYSTLETEFTDTVFDGFMHISVLKEPKSSDP